MSSATEDIEMADVEDDSDEEDAVAEELGRLFRGIFTYLAEHLLNFSIDKSEDESEPEGEIQDEEDQPPPLPKGQRNSQLTVGYKGDRSYVVRGNNIGVFSHTGDNVRYHATIGNLITPKGKEFAPKEVHSIFLLLLSWTTGPDVFGRSCFTSKIPR